MQHSKHMLDIMTSWVKALSPNCREVTQLQSRALDGPLQLRSWVGMQVHLRLCKWCRRYGQQIRLLRDTLQREGDKLTEPPHSRLPDGVREQIKELVRRSSES